MPPKKKPRKQPGKRAPTRADLARRVSAVHKGIEEISEQAAALGLGNGSIFAPRGAEGAERATSAALFVAWRATQALGAMLDEHRDEWAKTFGPQLVKAENILRGGNVASASGQAKSLAVACATMTFRGHAPKYTPDEGAQYLLKAYGRAFGDIFDQLPRADVASLIGEAQKRDDAAHAAAVKAGARKWKDLKPSFWRGVDRLAAGLACDVLWMGYEVAQARGVAADEKSFRFPLDNPQTKRTLHNALLNFARKKRPA